jgi:aminoglycoside 6'-N-acetyltransferase
MYLRLATSADQPLLEHWDRQPHIILNAGADGGFDWAAELPQHPPWRELLIAEHRGRPIGFIQIIDPKLEATGYWGEVGPDLRAIDIWIGELADTGRGLGTRMMRLALERCFADPAVTAVLVDPLLSNTRGHRFYQRLGFVPVERRRFGPDDCLVHRLSRERYLTAPSESPRTR